MNFNNEVKSNEPLNAVDKVLSVIDCIFEEEATFNDIQRKLNLPKATLHRILQSLESYQLVEKDSISNLYRLGIKFIFYSDHVMSRLTLPAIGEKYLQRLVDETGESASLSVYYESKSLSIASAEGTASALTSKLVPFSPLNCSASGKIFLSGFSDAELEKYFNSEQPVKKTIRSILTFEEYKSAQNDILQNHIAIDDEEYEYGLFCMSTPLYNHDGPIGATIGITAPKARLFMQDTEKIKEILLSVANDFSQELIRLKYELEY